MKEFRWVWYFKGAINFKVCSGWNKMDNTSVGHLEDEAEIYDHICFDWYIEYR